MQNMITLVQHRHKQMAADVVAIHLEEDLMTTHLDTSSDKMALVLSTSDSEALGMNQMWANIV